MNWCIAGLNDSSPMASVSMEGTLRGRLRQCGLTVDGHPPILELEGHELVDSLSWWAVEAPWSQSLVDARTFSGRLSHFAVTHARCGGMHDVVVAAGLILRSTAMTAGAVNTDLGW